MRTAACTILALATVGYAEGEEDTYYTMAEYAWDTKTTSFAYHNTMIYDIENMDDEGAVTSNDLEVVITFGFKNYDVSDVEAWSTRKGTSDQTGWWWGIGFN